MTKAIMNLAFPLMINNLIQTLYNMVDGIWLGRLGATEFAATTFVSPVIFLFITVGSGLSAAGTTIMSQMLGSGKKKEASGYVFQLFVIGLVLSCAVSVLGFALSPFVVRGMGATGELASFSTTYLSITFLGYPPVLIAFAMAAVMQSQGNTKAITIASGLSSIVNIILDPIFIFEKIPFIGTPGLNLGVAGAALATIISQYVMMLIGIWIVTHYHGDIEVKIKGQKVDKEKIKHLIKIGIPSIIGQSSASIGFIVLNVFITAYGTAVLAAYGVVNRITSLLMMPTMGIGAAIPAIIGQNMGAKNYDRVRECFNKSHIISFVISTAGAFLMYFMAKPMILIFIRADEIAALMPDAMEYIIYSLFIMPMMGGFSVFHGFFQGTGHTEYGMKMSMYRLWLIRLPMIFVLQKVTNLGASGIWIAMLLSNLFVNIYAYYHYKKDNWMVQVV